MSAGSTPGLGIDKVHHRSVDRELQVQRIEIRPHQGWGDPPAEIEAFLVLTGLAFWQPLFLGRGLVGNHSRRRRGLLWQAIHPTGAGFTLPSWWRRPSSQLRVGPPPWSSAWKRPSSKVSPAPRSPLPVRRSLCGRFAGAFTVGNFTATFLALAGAPPSWPSAHARPRRSTGTDQTFGQGRSGPPPSCSARARRRCTSHRRLAGERRKPAAWSSRRCSRRSGTMSSHAKSRRHRGLLHAFAQRWLSSFPGRFSSCSWRAVPSRDKIEVGHADRTVSENSVIH